MVLTDYAGYQMKYFEAQFIKFVYKESPEDCMVRDDIFLEICLRPNLIFD